MTWYRDIFPCNACVNGPYVGRTCRKGHLTTYDDGCSKCGILVNLEWYFEGVKCPDFEQRGFDDPSGS